jgi:hypothetical protein
MAEPAIFICTYTYLFYRSQNFRFQTVTRLAPTICYARRPKDVFQTLTDDLCGTGYTANSTVLDANKNYVLTCGKAIRGFDDAVIKTTFDDFYKSHSILHMAGLEYDDNNMTVEIEKISPNILMLPIQFR